MADATPSDHTLSGRLLAALWTLRLLSTSEGSPPEPEEFLSKKVPAQLLGEELPHLAAHLVRARSRGGEHWRAAVTVYRELPDLLPSARLPHATMGPDEQAAFSAGYAARLAQDRKEFGELLG
ncbi:hypothetical protein [Streptomyces capillispiralis]|uniref:Uncharacterized protein n=1 Tax=Streptomyces capillispiralis TaxID=68182 RepID=A0A561TJV8_9ACTN|nr:hypothetical protein [Streptomyces capillispiralis]TWF87342.1 hypothetical protein FHX78_114350 [Streptomyces capillispiralis]GHH92735.1 hypothetical protein GCM10017779_31920 [Streptomyces capillispiralis]